MVQLAFDVFVLLLLIWGIIWAYRKIKGTAKN